VRFRASEQQRVNVGVGGSVNPEANAQTRSYSEEKKKTNGGGGERGKREKLGNRRKKMWKKEKNWKKRKFLNIGIICQVL
jgi:hypothetical protein